MGKSLKFSATHEAPDQGGKQIDRFKQTAHEIGAEESEDAFGEKLKQLAKAKLKKEKHAAERAFLNHGCIRNNAGMPEVGRTEG